MQVVKLSPPYSRRKVIKTATVKDFSGGLNLSDDDLNLDSRYAKVLKNMYRSRDGRLRLRYGATRLFGLTAYLSGTIVAMEYFAGSLIVVSTDGEVVRVALNTQSTVITKIWPTTTKSWNVGVLQVNFTQSQNELVIVNGKDKPLRLKADFTIDFLGDAGNLNSNANTPIAPYVTSCQNYVVMAGVPAFPTKLYISAKNTNGTYSGDKLPNDATTFDVGTAVGHGDNRIVGLSSLNNSLFVAFETSTIVVQLGDYTGTAHTPSILDVFDTFGAVSQKTMTPVDKELWYCDQSGVLRVGRNAIGTSFIPERVSQMIDPVLLRDLQYSRNLGNISLSFALFNRLASQYMLFIPSNNAGSKDTWVATRYSPNDPPSWSQFQGMNFRGGVITSIGKMYLFTSQSIYVYGDVNAEVFSDDASGISFVWETPWSAFQEYDHIKKVKAIRIYTKGSAEFTFSVFTDGIYLKDDGSYNPMASLVFTAGDTGGFGEQSGVDGYGGQQPSALRLSNDPRIWSLNARFIQGKFQISGIAKSDLQITGISVSYTVGGRKYA